MTRHAAFFLAVILGAVVGFGAGRASAAGGALLVSAPVAAPRAVVARRGASTRYSVGDGRGAVDPGNGNHDGLSSSPLEGSPAKAPATVLLPPYPAADVLEESVGGTLELPAAVIGGVATWYDDGPGLYGAVPSWHWGDRPYSVRVCHGSRCVVVTVRDFCGCPGNRVIDLSPSAFRRLAPLSRGVVTVTVQDARGGPLPTPPATDTGP